jgi:phosphocarrier protein
MSSTSPVVRVLRIVNEKGLHARASAKFVNVVESFKDGADVTVAKGDETVSGNSIMGLMMLGAGPGSTILVHATGKQAREALDAITTLVENGFDEDNEGVSADS